MKYKSVITTRLGGPEVLQVIENDLRAPAAGEARIKVLAASVCRPDVTARQGKGLYSGTPLGQKVPFVPGYAIIGVVDAVGAGVEEVCVGDRVGALTVIGGYSEYLYWKSDRLIPVPCTVDPAKAVTLILNYIVAYQVLHRSAKVKAGEKVLIIGASGGIGTALLQLGKLAGLKMYGVASRSKHQIITEYGAIPIDYRTEDFGEVLRQAEPEGMDVVIDGMMRWETIQGGFALLRNGGRLVSYGEPAGFSVLFRILRKVLAVNLFQRGKSIKLYGTSFYFLGDQETVSGRLGNPFPVARCGQNQPGHYAAFSDPGSSPSQRSDGNRRSFGQPCFGRPRTAAGSCVNCLTGFRFLLRAPSGVPGWLPEPEPPRYRSACARRPAPGAAHLPYKRWKESQPHASPRHGRTGSPRAYLQSPRSWRASPPTSPPRTDTARGPVCRRSHPRR